MSDNTELIISEKGELLDIFKSEIDMRDTDLLKMSNFFDIYVNKLSTTLKNKTSWELIEDVSRYIGSMSSAIKGGFDVLDMKMFVADTSHFSKEIVDGLKNGIYHIGESREVSGNMRPAVVDENERLVKFITLKKAVRPAEVLLDISNLTMQASLNQISEKIDCVSRDVNLLIGLERRAKLSTPFLNARDRILSAVNSEENLKEQYLHEADKYLMEGLNELYSDIKSHIKQLAQQKGPLQSLKTIDSLLAYIEEDMQMIPQYVGLRVYLLNSRGLTKDASRVLGDYRYHLESLSNMKLEDSKYTAIELIHKYYEYEESNMDFWLEQPKEILTSLKSYELLLEKQSDEVFYIDTEEVPQNE